MTSLQQHATTYRNQFVSGRLDEKAFLQRCTWSEALRRAGFQLLADGSRDSHHWRRQETHLTRAYQALVDRQDYLRASCSFDELLGRVSWASHGLPWIGPLHHYDAALKLGCNLGLEPILVYMHAGVRKGARALHLMRLADPDIKPALIPYAELSGFTADELENFFCTFGNILLAANIPSPWPPAAPPANPPGFGSIAPAPAMMVVLPSPADSVSFPSVAPESAGCSVPPTIYLR